MKHIVIFTLCLFLSGCYFSTTRKLWSPPIREINQNGYIQDAGDNVIVGFTTREGKNVAYKVPKGEPSSRWDTVIVGIDDNSAYFSWRGLVTLYPRNPVKATEVDYDSKVDGILPVDHRHNRWHDDVYKAVITPFAVVADCLFMWWDWSVVYRSDFDWYSVSDPQRR